MKTTLRMLLWLPVLVLAAGCASGGGGSGGAAVGTYTRDFGRLLLPTLDEARQKIWSKHNWHVRRQQIEYQNIYWESEWRPFNPPGGASFNAPTEARGRIVIRGRRVASELGTDASGSPAGVYRVTYVGEYQVRGGPDPDWRPAPMPDEVREVFEEVAGDLALEVRTGVRRR